MDNETIPGLLRRLDYFWDKLLCNLCCEEKDGVWAKGTTEDKLWWIPDTTGCPECKHFGRWLQHSDERPEDV